MMRRILRHIALLALAASALPAGACPQRVPAGLASTVVGQDVHVDRLSLSILKVEGTEQGAAVLERVERAWRAEGFQVKRNRAPGWDIVAALGERCLTTLQLQDKGAASGFFAVNPLALARRTAPPMPAGARLLSSVASQEDDGRRGLMSALVSGQPLDALRTYYMQRLRADDWESIRADVSEGGAGTRASVVLSAQRGRERIEVILWREGESHIVINQAEAL